MYGENSVPLVRYHIADKGGLIGFEEMQAFLESEGVEVLSQLDLPNDFQPRELPFVYVFGRADFTVSYYGANIYPENVSVGLEQPDIMSWVTGKFVLEIRETGDGDNILHIAVELLPGTATNETMVPIIAESIRKELLRLNSEFSHYLPVERQMPQVTLHAFADAEYFPAGVKHRYTQK